MDVTTNCPDGIRRRDDFGKSCALSGKQAGITLVELISTLAIIAILIGGLTTPLQEMLAGNRVTAQVNHLLGDLAFTRSTAITHQQHSVICKSRDGKQCTRQGDWGQGWIVYIDANHNHQRDGAEQLLRVSSALPDALQLSYDGFGSDHYITYRPSGLTRTNGSFVLCPAGQQKLARAVIVYKTGRVRVSKKQAKGGKLKCP